MTPNKSGSLNNQVQIKNGEQMHRSFELSVLKFVATICFLAAGICFIPRLGQLWSTTESSAVAESTFEATDFGFITKPIEKIQVGERVLSKNPEISEQARAARNRRKIGRENWKKIEMVLESHSGQTIEINLLRPADWVQEFGVVVGKSIDLNLEELGLRGEAGVLTVSGASNIAEGTGELVTGTFRHFDDDLSKVFLEESGKPIICTSSHPFWSIDRGLFIDAADLERGELLLNANGKSVKVAEVVALKGQDAVYNIEVEFEHVYFVHESGILVHNVRSCINHKNEGKKVKRGGIPRESTYPSSKSKFAKKPQADPDEFRRQPTDAMGIREHQQKHPEIPRKDYLNSAIETTLNADYVRYDKTRGSGRLQYFKKTDPDGGGLFTVASVDGKTLYTHFYMDGKTAKKNGFVPRAQRGGS